MATTTQATQPQPIDGQVLRLKQQLAEAQTENGRNKQRLEKLSLVVLERERKIAELQHYEHSFRKMSEQKRSAGAIEDTSKEQLLALQTDLNAANEHKQKLEDLLKQERAAREEAVEEVQALYAQFETLKKMLADSKLKSEAWEAERIELINALEKVRQEEIGKAEALRSEVESHLKIAQQHLAKKVRETSELSDKVRAQELLIYELQGNLDQSHVRISEQQHLLDVQLQHEKRLQEQLRDAVRIAESSVGKWEEKYFNIYEKWQACEMQLREMRKIETKHVQLQALLANIGGLFDAPICSTQIVEQQMIRINEEQGPDITPIHQPSYEIETETTPVQELPPIVETSNMKKPYQNLVDLSLQNKRLKHTLLE